MRVVIDHQHHVRPSSPEAYTALFDPADITVAARTARSHGVVGGAHPVLPRIVAQFATPGETRILDLGAGPLALQASAMRDAGFLVDAVDVGPNWSERHHDRIAFRRRYDIVFASNVLNVQVSSSMLTATLRAAAAWMRPRGCLLANYPSDPRLLGWDADRVEAALRGCFSLVERLRRSARCGYGSVVFRCSRTWPGADPACSSHPAR